VCAKRLEAGRFSWPAQSEETVRVRLDQAERSLLFGGIELSQTRRKNWYRQVAETEESSL
jgi:hypothetical protein